MSKKLLIFNLLLINFINLFALEPKVRWGILSTAQFANTMVPAIKQSNRSEVAAVASRSIEKAQKFAKEKGIAIAYGSYQELLDDKTIDVIYNALPNSLHAQWTLKAIEAGKHVLCEKPFVLKLEDLDKIEKLAKEKSVIVFEGFIYLHHKQTQKILEIINSGKIGTVKFINAWFSFDLFLPENEKLRTIRLNKELGGGAIWDLGAYPCSSAITFAQNGIPKKIFAEQIKDENGVDLSTFAQLTFDNGIVAQISASFNTPYRKILKIIGSKGILTINNPWQPGKLGKDCYIYFSNSKDPKETYTIEQTKPYIYEMINKMEDCILIGSNPEVTFERSRDFLRTLLTIQKSAELGQVITP